MEIPKICGRDESVSDIVERFTKAYERRVHYNIPYEDLCEDDKRKVDRCQRIMRQLRLLENITADSVERIIGNDSWTGYMCVNCHKKHTAVGWGYVEYNNGKRYCFYCFKKLYPDLYDKYTNNNLDDGHVTIEEESVVDFEIFTSYDMAKCAADRWKSQYFQDGKWTDVKYKASAAIYHDLVALGNNPEPNLVNKIVGNPTWTTITCQCCSRGTEYVYVVNDVYYCTTCFDIKYPLTSKVSRVNI